MTHLDDNQPDAEMRAEERALAQVKLIGRIKTRMEVLGLNPYSAAKKAGLGNDYVRDILRGKVANPSAERLGKLAVALECSLYYLLGQEEMEITHRTHDPAGGYTEVPPPPPPLPTWKADQGKPFPNLVPIRYELMADAWRKATDVTRKPIGYEATTIPPAAGGREVWWELVRDNSMQAVAPEGSLVLVAEYRDDERELIADGELVVITRRMMGPTSEYHIVERSMRRVRYRYPDLGLWFLEHAQGGDPEEDLTDDIWRETKPTEPRRGWREKAADIADPAEREAYEAEWRDFEAQVDAAKSSVDREKFEEFNKRLSDPAFVSGALSAHEQWRPRLAGKVLRVLTPVAAGADFGL